MDWLRRMLGRYLDTLAKKVAAGLTGVVVGTVVVGQIHAQATAGRYRITRPLNGKVIVISGATSGIGEHVFLRLAEKGATVHVLARNLKAADDLVNRAKIRYGNADLFVHHVDMSDLHSVRRFARVFKEHKHIDVLINNAGLVNRKRRVTTDGFEETFQVNTLAPFLLTKELMDKMVERGKGRILNISSDAHSQATDFDVDDLNLEKKGYKLAGATAYCWSKLGNMLFTNELAHKLRHTGVTTNSVHPGMVRSDLARDYPFWHPIKLITHMVKPFSKSCSLGADTIVHAAVAPELENISGLYLVDCKPDTPTLASNDEKVAKKFWENCEKMLQDKLF